MRAGGGLPLTALVFGWPRQLTSRLPLAWFPAQPYAGVPYLDLTDGRLFMCEFAALPGLATA